MRLYKKLLIWKRKKIATFPNLFFCFFCFSKCCCNAIPSPSIFLCFLFLSLHPQSVFTLMVPIPAKHHAPTLSVCHVAPRIQVASRMGYAGTIGILCFGDHVAIRVGSIPIALDFVASVSNPPPPPPPHTPLSKIKDLLRVLD